MVHKKARLDTSDQSWSTYEGNIEFL